MVTGASDRRQPPFGGRVLRVLTTAAAAAVALLVIGAAPAQGVRSTDAAATTSATASAARSAYELVSPGTELPLRWLACRPIAYRINPVGMPKGMDAVVKRVMTGIGKQTGVTFRYAGTTKRTFGTTTRSSTPTISIGFTAKHRAYGHTFAYPGEIGVGGPTGAYVSGYGRPRYEAITSGRVLLSTAFHGPRAGAGATWPSLIRHEVGHALNLAHRTAATAVMNPTLSDRAPSRYSPSEVAALHRVLQRTGCDYTDWRRL